MKHSLVHNDITPLSKLLVPASSDITRMGMSNKHLPITECTFQFEIALEHSKHNILMNEHGEIDDQLMCH